MVTGVRVTDYSLSLLAIALVCHAAICAVSFEHKNAPWSFPAMAAGCVAVAYLWLLAARVYTDPKELLLFSFIWDLAATVLYTVLPVIFFKAQPTLKQAIGIAIMLAGSVFLK